MKALLRFGAAGAVAAVAIVLVRKYDLIARGAAVADQLIEAAAVKTEQFFGKTIGLADDMLTKFAENAAEQQQGDEHPGARVSGQTTYHMSDVYDEATRR